MKLVGSGPGHEIDIRTAGDGELRIRNVRLDVEFLNGIGRRRNRPHIGVDIVVQNAVNGEVVLVGSLPTDSGGDASRSQGNRESRLLPTFLRRRSWGQERKLRELASIQG